MKIRGTTVFLIVVVVILLIVAVIANINQFDQLGWFSGCKAEQQSKPVVEQSDTGKDPDGEIPTSGPETEGNSAEPAKTNWRASLSPALYGRTNPFLPLRGARPPDPKPVPPVPPGPDAPGPLMQVTAIFGGQAIIKVDGADKTVSAGDTLAETEVVSVGENEVLLRKEDKDYTLTLGEEPKHVPPGEAE